MQTLSILTDQSTPLIVTLTARERILGGHPQPIVEFRYLGGILCSSYYLSDFLAVSGGLCLMGGQFSRLDLSAESVSVCQQWCNANLQETN
jgi:hypothetical protein